MANLITDVKDFKSCHLRNICNEAYMRALSNRGSSFSDMTIFDRTNLVVKFAIKV